LTVGFFKVQKNYA